MERELGQMTNSYYRLIGEQVRLKKFVDNLRSKISYCKESNNVYENMMNVAQLLFTASVSKFASKLNV